MRHTLDASLGLGREREDQLDLQRVECATDFPQVRLERKKALGVYSHTRPRRLLDRLLITSTGATLMTSHIVKNPEEYGELMNLVQQAVIVENRFPEQVFRRWKRVLICEFDDMFSPGFWKGIQGIATRSGDTRIACAILQPPPEYFKIQLEYYGVLNLDVHDTADLYVDLLATEPPHSPADAFLYNCDVVAATSDSLHWQLWAERGPGVAILAVNDDQLVRMDEFATVHWMSAPEALWNVISLTFLKQVIPIEFNNLFQHNYGEPRNEPARWALCS
jgi:hypothetical protein